jgi:DNA processing protein
VDRLGDPTCAFSLSRADLAQVSGLEKNVIDGLSGFSEWAQVEVEAKRAMAAGARVVPFVDPAYPEPLKNISNPPPFLYVKGELSPQDARAIAIVGSRSASARGLEITRELSGGLAALGFTIVSGMARGVDGEAHLGALAAGGRTLAVLGCGVDVVYPPEHAELYEKIVSRGAVVSELRMGSPPAAHHFPVRNRLISGLAAGVVVVEATEKSGSLITASCALDQGREVFAVPGEAGSSRSRGPHRLIRQGAKLVESVADVVEEIAPQLVQRARATVPPTVAKLPAGADPDARAVMDLVSGRPVQIDDLIETSRLPLGRLSEVLLELELQGFLTQLPGKRFVAAGRY